ncbi:hypothetical protein [Oceanobacillus sp. J11TS1]|nr:hypothetical protein [Oceanobacillus sp. J11TS1]GIO23943.1 hypothetical protein J11TS1_25240 [Oceanobacillus sp. J11TS1]
MSDGAKVLFEDPLIQDRLMKEEYGKLTEEKVEQILRREKNYLKEE